MKAGGKALARTSSSPEKGLGSSPRPAARPARDDDGTMYNPFADALRKIREKDAGKKEKNRKP
jgi:hypothetical protein